MFSVFLSIFSVLISVLVSAVDISGRERQAGLLVFDKEIVELNVMDRLEPKFLSGFNVRFKVVDQEDFVRLKIGNFPLSVVESNLIDFREGLERSHFETCNSVVREEVPDAGNAISI